MLFKVKQRLYYYFKIYFQSLTFELCKALARIVQ